MVLDPSFLNAVNTSIIPVADNSYDLGSSSYRWRNLYLAGSLTGSYLYVLPSGHSYLYYGSTTDILLGLPQRHNVLRYRLPSSIEYYDYSSGAWTAWSGVSTDVLVDGRYDRALTADYTHRTFRVTWSGVGWCQPVALAIHLQWTSSGWDKSFTVTVETSSDGSTWTTRNQYTLPGSVYQHIVPLSDWGGDNYVRITFNVALQSGDTWSISEVEILSTRTNWAGDNDFPIDVDGYRRIMQSLVPSSDNAYDIGSSTNRWANLYLAGVANVGSLQIGGTTVIDSNRVLQNIASVSQTLTPSADNTYDLGSSSYRWRTVYAVNIYGALISLD